MLDPSEKTARSAPLAAAGALLALMALAGLARAGEEAPRPPPPAPVAVAPDAGPGPTQVRRLLEERPLDLNAATGPDLELLPRIGPTLASRIVEDREERGAYPSVDALTRVRGIGPHTLERLRPLVTVGCRGCADGGPPAGDALRGDPGTR